MARSSWILLLALLMGCSTAAPQPEMSKNDDKAVQSTAAGEIPLITGEWSGSLREPAEKSTKDTNYLTLRLSEARFSEYEIKKVKERSGKIFLAGVASFDFAPKRHDMTCPFAEEQHYSMTGALVKGRVYLSGLDYDRSEGEVLKRVVHVSFPWPPKDDSVEARVAIFNVTSQQNVHSFQGILHRRQ